MTKGQACQRFHAVECDEKLMRGGGNGDVPHSEKKSQLEAPCCCLSQANQMLHQTVKGQLS